MPITELPFAEGLYEDQYAYTALNRCVNFFPHTPDGPAVSGRVLRTTPGIDLLYAPGVHAGSRCYAATSTDTSAYFVNDKSAGTGAELIEMTLTSFTGDSPVLTVTNRGGFNSGAWKRVDDVAVGRDEIMFITTASGGEVYTYNPSTTSLAEVTDADLVANGSPTSCTYLDGYFVLTTDENKIIVSALNDGRSYNALDFASAEYDPDGITCVFVYQNQLHVGGTNTIESFNNIGGSGFPFQRTGMFYDYGVTTPRLVVNHATGVYFHGRVRNGGSGFFVLNANGVQKISTKEIDTRALYYDAIGAAAFTGSAYHHSYHGHEFIVFNIDGTCLVYDISEQAWHERESSGASVAYRANYVANLQGFSFVGDSEDGRFGRFEQSTGSSTGAEYTQDVTRTFETPFLVNQLQPFSVSFVELATGYPAAGVDFTMETSQPNSESYTSMGSRASTTDSRYVWRRMGRFDTWASLRFSVTSDKAFDVVKVVADVTA